MTRYCCSGRITSWEAFMRVCRLLFFVLLGPASYALFLGLIMDGYFETSTRYIYCYHASNNSTNSTLFNTTIQAFGNCSITNLTDCTCKLTINETDAMSRGKEIQTIIQPGVFSNVSLGFIPGTAVTASGENQVPWIAFITVAIGFGITMALNVSSWINSRIVVFAEDIDWRRYFNKTFFRGPGASLVHLICIYLSMALVALFPDVSWWLRLFPIYVSAVYVGLSQIAVAMHFGEDVGTITIFGIVPISVFVSVQVIVTAVQLDAHHDWWWQASLTPLWILCLLLVIGCVIPLIMFGPYLIPGICSEEVIEAGAISAYSFFGFFGTICVYITLLRACMNDRSWNPATWSGAFTWMEVVAPLIGLVVAYAFVLVMDQFLDLVSTIVRCGKGMHHKAVVLRKARMERTKHLITHTWTDAREPEDEDPEHNPNNPNFDVLKKINLNRFDSDQNTLITLSTIRNNLKRNQWQRTPVLKKNILEKCREGQLKEWWGRTHAIVLGEILRMCTPLGTLVEQDNVVKTLAEHTYSSQPRPPTIMDV